MEKKIQAIYIFSERYLNRELPLKIVKPLQKVEVTEKDQVVMTCEVNKPNIKAKWFKDKQEVEPSENVHITTQGRNSLSGKFRPARMA